MEEVEELITLHNFVKSANKINNGGGPHFSGNMMEHSLGSPEFNDKHGNKRKKNRALQAEMLNDQFIQQTQMNKRDIDSQLMLLSLEKVCVSKISCSNKHSLIVSSHFLFNISALTLEPLLLGEKTIRISQVFTPEKQAKLHLPYNMSQNPERLNRLGNFPFYIDNFFYSRQFVIDVACGDYHSCILNNQKEVYVWGSNKDGQLGLDHENCQSSGKAIKVVLDEYMNSSNKEKFVSVRAKTNYTVLICETKNVRKIDCLF